MSSIPQKQEEREMAKIFGAHDVCLVSLWGLGALRASAGIRFHEAASLQPVDFPSSSPILCAAQFGLERRNAKGTQRGIEWRSLATPWLGAFVQKLGSEKRCWLCRSGQEALSPDGLAPNAYVADVVWKAGLSGRSIGCIKMQESFAEYLQKQVRLKSRSGDGHMWSAKFGVARRRKLLADFQAAKTWLRVVWSLQRMHALKPVECASRISWMNCTKGTSKCSWPPTLSWDRMKRVRWPFRLTGLVLTGLMTCSL